ncbi:MAG TPA: diaminopimelate epimerase [Candidatus Nitrosotalea sp.]|nr:diaminopimelate epimerase [Candidatus Nitrosotalea sp.]
MPVRTSPAGPWRLDKYQALGNDYLVLERSWIPTLNQSQLSSVVRQLCHRHLGLGADGLLLFDPSSMALRIFNPDGSEAEKSGNGLRIAACHAVLEHGAPSTFDLRTQDRANPVRILARRPRGIDCEVEMGRPTFDPDRWLHLGTPAGRVRCRLVGIGNPHCVVFDQPVSAERCLELGPGLERHRRFGAARTNVQLVEVLARDRIRIEIWERGAGRTLASGSSATAVAALVMHLGYCGDEIRVLMPGGELGVRREEAGTMLQSGPSEHVFTAWVDPDQLLAGIS